MLRRTLLCVLLVVCESWLSVPARAQAPAERALSRGDFAKARELAEAALQAGAVKPAQWTSLQHTLGVASAHLGEAEQARRAFVCALALDPDLRLPADESVDVRSPFMEARGFWSQHAQRLAASASLSEDRQALVVSLVDPAALVARVLVQARGVGQSRFVEFALPTASSMLLSLEQLPTQAGVEFTLALIDENANRLWQLGSEDAPLSSGRAHSQPEPTGEPQPAAPPLPPPAAPAARSARGYYAGAAVSLLVSAGAFVVAGMSHRERERLAARWNSADCDGEGDTRGEVCKRERDQLEHQQRLAIGFYALGGVGLAVGIASLLLAPRRARSDSAGALRALRCQSGPGLVGVECGGKF
jgi:hypothetical protein